MARVLLPLLALKAKGTIGKAIVYAEWKHLAYARAYALPRDAKTTGKLAHRSKFRNLCAAWSANPYCYDYNSLMLMSVSLLHLSITGFNLFIRKYMAQDEANCEFFKTFSCYAEAGAPGFVDIKFTIFSYLPFQEFTCQVLRSYFSITDSINKTTNAAGEYYGVAFTITEDEFATGNYSFGKIAWPNDTKFLFAGIYELLYY